MITQDDIDAFRENHAEDLEAAKTYRQRAERGLPSDRWADGERGCIAVARGIYAQEKLLEIFAATTLQMMQMIKESGEMSMGIGPAKDEVSRDG